jgi:hypothetical protein
MTAEIPAHESLQVVAGEHERNWFCSKFLLANMLKPQGTLELLSLRCPTAAALD